MGAGGGGGGGAGEARGLLLLKKFPWLGQGRAGMGLITRGNWVRETWDKRVKLQPSRIHTANLGLVSIKI